MRMVSNRAQNIDHKTNNFVEDDKSPLLNDTSRTYFNIYY